MDYYKKHQSLKNLSIRSEDFKDLSFRAMRVCRDNNFNSVSDIIVFIKKGGRLSNLKSCGKKTVLEIEELVKGRIENENLKLYDKLKEKYKKIRDDKWKKQLFDANFKSLLNNLSVRSRNGYILIVKNDQNGVDSFIDKVFFNNLDFESIRNMGKKSIIELEFFKKNIKSLIEDYSEKEINEFDLIIKNLENFLGFSFDEIESSEHKLIESIKNKEVDLIYFFDFYILNYYIKKDVDKFLLIKYLYPKNKEFNTNEQIAEKSGLTRERVRQKGVKVLNERRFYNLSNLIPLSFSFGSKYEPHSQVAIAT